ncbi:glycosyltransferase [Legionella fairfieldensis]|uniref:glycosyltransferase n=1 Tax=Legionella fairfieldensis TaxID=45064 RepID=UPI001A93B4B3|nr:glycosyltransferase [Legionella fairfieldensis]
MTISNNFRPKCAVLLAVYNGMQYIEEQVQTILNQTGVCVTIFVSIDVSSDGSEEWFSNLAERDPRIVLLPYGVKFGGAAKNFFRLIRDVDFSQFDYIAFSDQDDLWYLDKLYKASVFLKKNAFHAYSSNVMAFWPNGRKMLVNKAQSQKTWDFLFEAAGPGCTYVISVKLMSAIKERLIKNWDIVQQVSLHDWYCYAFARANGYQWFIDPAPSMLYRQHGKNQVGVNTGVKAYLNRIKQIKNGWWLTQAYLVASLVDLGSHSFVKSWSKLGRVDLLRLATCAFQCRRRLQEQLFFFFICLTLAITGGGKKMTPGNFDTIVIKGTE